MKDLLRESKEFKILFKKSTNLLNGKYSSRIKGDGIEFVDLKEYVPGDDIRKIDWKVTAREGRVFVKEFLEDRDASHYILIDTSLSQKNKLEFLKILSTSLLLSSYNSRDGFSIIFFNDEEIKVFPLSKNRSQLMRYIYEISKMNLKSTGNLAGVLRRLLPIIHRKSIISIISDELELNLDEKKYLNLIKKKHKLNYFFLFSSNERNLESGLISYEDIETGFNSVYDLTDEELEEYTKEFDRSINHIESSLMELGIKPFILDSDLSLKNQINKMDGLKL